MEIKTSQKEFCKSSSSQAFCLVSSNLNHKQQQKEHINRHNTGVLICSGTLDHDSIITYLYSVCLVEGKFGNIGIIMDCYIKQNTSFSRKPTILPIQSKISNFKINPFSESQSIGDCKMLSEASPIKLI